MRATSGDRTDTSVHEDKDGDSDTRKGKGTVRILAKVEPTIAKRRLDLDLA
jgi:hypothetical protein